MERINKFINYFKYKKNINEPGLLRNKEAIKYWLDVHKITQYKIIEDKKYGYIVHVNGNVEINNRGIRYIKIKFGAVNGNFNCSNNDLTSLEGCPFQVNGQFNCEHNRLTNLVHGPKVVNGLYICSFNQLNNFEGYPKFVAYEFYAHQNPLTPELQNLIHVINYKLLKSMIDIFYEKRNLDNEIRTITKKKVTHKL